MKRVGARWWCFLKKTTGGMSALNSSEPPILLPNEKILYSDRSYKEPTDTVWPNPKRLGSDFEDIRIKRVTASTKDTNEVSAKPKTRVLPGGGSADSEKSAFVWESKSEHVVWRFDIVTIAETLLWA